jgi:hypothetical protein
MVERDDERDQRGGHASGGEIDPEAPPTAEEIAAAARLRDALEDPAAVPGADEDVDFVRSLKAAWSPAPLDPHVHAEMIDDLPTAEELALAEELRRSLEPSGRPPEIVAALRAAWRPSPIDESEHRTIVERAVGRAPTAKVVPLAGRRARGVRLVVVTTTSVLALAASVVVWLTPAQRAEAPLAKARSTQPLFDEPFKAGEMSARIDRIAMARASEYRDNRFAKWGVR